VHCGMCLDLYSYQGYQWQYIRTHCGYWWHAAYSYFYSQYSY